MAFPKEIFVTQEREGSTDYLYVQRSPADGAEIGKQKRVAVYRLVGMQTIRGVVERSAVERIKD